MITRFLFALGLMIAMFTPGAVVAEDIKIVIIAGAVKEVDRVGHHDYLGGCRLLEELLKQTPGVHTVLVKQDWPESEVVFDNAAALVFYTDGGGKQAYLQTPERIATIQKLVDAGVGIVSVHQAVEFPPQNAKQSGGWTGALYNKAFSGRGHWDSKHEVFPDHPTTRGVVAWEIIDGWLNGFKFAPEMKGVTPLVWSGKEHQGSIKGGDSDVVAWAFDRADGGKSFNFSGLDGHSAWERDGMRKLMVNGVLWSAGLEIPEAGASCTADKEMIDSFLTPRIAPKPAPKKS
ncbi:MAG: hypothetical protein ACI8UO_002319 [Verrucomicrobiales bacterium]|jgi:hypothetical protein